MSIETKSDRRMVGRDGQVRRLQQFLTPAPGGETRVAIVSGRPGVGKSMLAFRTLAALAGTSWVFAAKFDQYVETRPAGFFIAMLAALAARARDLPEAERTALRAGLVDAISPNGQLVIRLCPDMAEVLGAQPELIELAPQENQVRLSIVLRKLVGALTRSGRRLTLLVDDLQWADPATLRLLCDFVSDPEIRNLAVLATVRTTAENAEPEAAAALRRVLRAAVVSAFEQPLEEFSTREIQAFIGDLVELPEDTAARLSREIKETSGGSPLAVISFIDLLISKRILRQAEADGAWSLPHDLAASLPGASGLLGLMHARLAAISPSALGTLRVAASLGHEVDAALLAELSEANPDAVRADLRELRDHAFLEPARTGASAGGDREVLRFVHDFIQQAAFEGAEAAETTRHRLRAARVFARRFTESGENEWLFRAVALYGPLHAAIPDPDERVAVAALHAQAARRALDSGGARMALAFARLAADMLGEDGWTADYPGTFALHRAGAEAAYLAGDRPMLERFCDAAARRARTVADWARAREMLLQERVSAVDYAEALDIALETLRRLDAPLPRDPGKAQVGLAFARTMLLLRNRPVEALLDLPTMRDDRAEREMETLMLAASTAYFARPNLFALIVLRMVRLSVAAGNSPLSAFGWECYGLAQCAVIGNVRLGHAYGVLGLRLAERFEAEHLRARLHMLFNVFVRHWREPRAEVAAHLLAGQTAGIATGDLEFAAYCAWHRVADAFWAGAPLAEIRPAAQEALALARRHAQGKVVFLLEMMLAFIDWGLAEGPARTPPDDAAHEAYCVARGDHTSLCYVLLFQALRHALSGDAAACLRATDAIERHYEALQGQFYGRYHFLLRAMAAAALARDAPRPAARRSLRRKAYAAARRLRRWTEKGSVDTAPVADLAEGFLAWAHGRPFPALRSLDRARVAAGPGAAGDASLLVGALAADAMARITTESGIAGEAAGLRREAARLTERWGVRPLADRLAAGAPTGPAGPVSDADDAASLPGAPLEAQARACAARLIGLADARAVEIVLAEEAAPVTLLRATRRQDAAPDVDLFDLAPERGTLDLARRTLAQGALTEGRVAALPLPQYDGAPVCLLLHEARAEAPGPAAAGLPGLAPLVAALRTEFLKQRLGREQSDRVALATAHGRIIPQYFLRTLGHSRITDLHVGDFVHKRMTVMFCDMRGSTGIVEQIGPQASMAMFNEIFTAIESEVLRGGGYVDNFIGDAVLSLFETPSPVVVGAAVAVSHELHRLHDAFEARGLPGPRFGIGLCTGDLVLGAVGGLNQIRGGSLGETMNLAARIEGLTRRYAANLLIADSTRAGLGEGAAFALRQVDHISVAGMKRPVRLFEVLDALPAAQAAARRATAAAFGDGVGHYYARDFARAAEAFRACVAAAPDDVAAASYLSRAEELRAAGVGADWTGVRTLTEK